MAVTIHYTNHLWWLVLVKVIWQLSYEMTFF